MNNKKSNAQKSNETIHSIVSELKRKRKHKHSRVPEATRNDIVMDLINNYEEYENGILTLKKGAPVCLGTKYNVDRRTISAMWKKTRKEPFLTNMRKTELQKKTHNHQQVALLNQKIKDLELQLKEKKNPTENMLNEMKLELEKVEKTGKRFQFLYEVGKKKNLELTNENETLKKIHGTIKEQSHLQQIMKEDMDRLLVGQ